MVEQGTLKSIKVEKLALDLDNPRHGKLQTPEEAIKHLVEKERVIDLALDIAAKGAMNPMDLLGVFRKRGAARSDVYISAEGNRRVCALMLLHDPEKIPKGVHERAKKIRSLEAAISAAPLPTVVNCIVFPTRKDAMPWIQLMHIADQDGRARKRWTPDQQGNAIGGGRNSDAIQVLDFAQAARMIDKVDRDAKLTTVQRYLSNPVMRNALGLERTGPKKELRVRLERSAFMSLIDRFVSDVRDGKLSSRSNSAAIVAYAEDLIAKVECDRSAAAPAPLADLKWSSADINPGTEPAQPTDPTPPPADPLPPPPVRTNIGRNPDLERDLFAVRSQKLQKLYLSCTGLSLKDHTALITVGVWSLLESLAQLHAEKRGGDPKRFIDYFTVNFFNHHLGLTDKEKNKTIRQAVVSIDDRGNSTKHHSVAAAFDGQQLANDFDVLTPMLKTVCASIIK